MFLVNLLRCDCLDNLEIVENVVDYFFVIVLHQFFTAYLHCNFGDVSFFARKNFIFCGISNFFFRVKTSGGVFLLRVSGIARFFPAVQTICKFEISLK